jgi:hypothetical protein
MRGAAGSSSVWAWSPPSQRPRCDIAGLPRARLEPLGYLVAPLGPEARRREHKAPAARQPSYASTMPAPLLQTPALTIVSRRGHVAPCRVLDHRPHAAREILGELAGCGGDGLGRIHAH